MDRAAAMGQAFMGLEEAGHRVSYFSLTNLSGALISIGIGTAVYLLVIRKALMDQAGRYINVWPVWLDLENLIYRPVLRLLILLARFAAGCWIALWISLSFSCAGVSTGQPAAAWSFRRAMSSRSQPERLRMCLDGWATIHGAESIRWNVIMCMYLLSGMRN